MPKSGGRANGDLWQREHERYYDDAAQVTDSEGFPDFRLL